MLEIKNLIFMQQKRKKKSWNFWVSCIFLFVSPPSRWYRRASCTFYPRAGLGRWTRWAGRSSGSRRSPRCTTSRRWSTAGWTRCRWGRGSCRSYRSAGTCGKPEEKSQRKHLQKAFLRFSNTLRTFLNIFWQSESAAVGRNLHNMKIGKVTSFIFLAEQVIS